MSLAAIVREVPRRPPVVYMESDLAILNAAHYDTGLPLPLKRSTRGSKRKLHSLLTGQDSASIAAEGRQKQAAATAKDKSTISASTGLTDAGPHTIHTTNTTTTEELLSAVDVAPFMDRARGAPALSLLPASKVRKPTAKRTWAKIANDPARAPGSEDSDDVDGDEEEEDELGDKKRSRGRPRIDVKDVTAADRRRTQIRLAQRAYRSRKEKAIVSLEKRVNALREANESMSNAFMALHDFAVERGLLDTHPDLAQQLRQTTEVFLEMARQSNADEEMEDHDDAESQEVAQVAQAAQAAQAVRTARVAQTKSQEAPHVADEALAHRRKQQAITEAVKTFGYQTTQQQQQQQQRQQSNVALSDETSIHQAQHIQEQLYGGIVMEPQQQQQPQQQSNMFSQPTSVFDNSLGLAMNMMSTVSPLSSSFLSSSGRDVLASTNDVNSSSSNTALSGSRSPVSGQANNEDFGSILDNPFTFDDPSYSLFPTYPSPLAAQDNGATAQPVSVPTSSPTSTSNLGPHLADTDAFIATASIGNPFPGLSLPRHIDIPGISFGLRLRRYVLESAYRLITAPDPPSDIFARVFGFSITFEPIEVIRQRLARGLETPLSANKFTRWELPFVTKTPDPDDEPSVPAQRSRPAPTPRGGLANNDSNSRNSSSSNNSSSSSSSSSDHRGTGVRTVVPRINVTLPGFEGAFYDCEETEMYLQQRGVHIPPNTDSIIVEVDDADFALDIAASTSGSRADGRSGNGPSITNTMTTTTASANFRHSLGGSGSGPTNRLYHPASSVGMFDYLSPDLVIPRTAASMDAVHFPRRRLLVLDVDKFVRELARRGICLGQTPGFRASDVNEAFRLATHNAGTA